MADAETAAADAPPAEPSPPPAAAAADSAPADAAPAADSAAAAAEDTPKPSLPPPPAAKMSAEGEKKSRTPPPEVLSRLGDKKSVEDISDDEVKAILKEYYDRWLSAESSLYDVEHDVKLRDMQIHELEMEVQDMRGKFIIPKLKKVHNFKLMGGDD